MRKLTILLSFSFSFLYLFAQTSDSTSSIAIQKAINNYRKEFIRNAPIYNGKEHIGYPDFYEGIAYFGSSNWQKGTINYEGIEYADVYLKYDMVSDEIIIRNPQGFSLNLFSPRTAWFTLSGNKFIYINKKESLLADGFYQVLSNGKLTVVAKKSKEINEDISSGKLIRRFKEKDAYYVLLNGTYSLIKNDHSIYDLIPEKKKQVKNFLKEKRIKYKTDPETFLINVANFYNGIIN